MRKWVVMGSVLVLAACTDVEEGERDEVAGNANGEDAMMEEGESAGNTQVLASNLEAPWAIEEEDGVFYLPQREGSLLRLEDGEVTEETLDLTEEVVQESESGLLGFLLDEEFTENKRAYVYHTYEVNGEMNNRIVALTHEDGTWTEEEVLLEEIPGAATHNGGRLANGPDGMLYATTGDAELPEAAQNTDSLAGKILRMDDEGGVPNDNPIEDSYVYSYGHRNPQGLAWLQDETMYASEHGPSAQDEINLIEAGNNYGWPEVEGDETAEGMEEPVIHSGDETWAPSGIAVHNDFIYMAGLAGAAVYQVDPNEGSIDELTEDCGRIRDVHVDGNSLYFLTNNTDGRGSPGEDDDRLIEWSLNGSE
ncbi:PQQ-dependent sugar dehydrogenase [Shouchella shacheensis]|uniref:PQQ-dependent sugar dehydrogenase n=1 Tax=Shouchella shacheensis TaxID=1649580 RepID=UPI000A415492|nr:PQQ-dependent sugar dehydrogenase [Shouchella shacheensis]